MPCASASRLPRFLAAFLCALTLDAAIARATDGAAVFERSGAPIPASGLDGIVFRQLAALGIEPAPLCSDAVFIRRVFLDVIGTLPTAKEVRSFLASGDPQKRAKLIDALLSRNEYADYWTMHWCDVLRVKSEFPINLWPNAAQAYHRWIYAAVRDNLPYDQFARTLLTSSGSNFRVGPVNFYRAAQSRDPQGLARVVALTFLGARIDRWPPEQRAGFASFFSAIGYKTTQEWKEEIVYFAASQLPDQGTTAAFPVWNPSGALTAPHIVRAKPVQLTRAQDPREIFATWLTAPENPWFARAYVNRVWAWLLGRGIVEDVDDLRPDNAPANPELLDYLGQRFIAEHYDARALLRLILNSRTYQLSSIARSTDPRAEANFAAYPLRRLDAEIIIDALNQITGTSEKYSSAIPEPFTVMPDEQRSIALPDGSITSSFLEMFGRPSRDTGEQAERNNRITASQRLHLLNSTQVQRKIEQGPKMQALFRASRPGNEVVTELYLTILSRPPTDAERATITEYATTHGRRRAAIDTAWALINSAEFLLKH